MAVSSPSDRVSLIPWDPISEAHVERLTKQRVACGWASEEVESWKEPCLKGTKFFYWIVLAEALPDREELLRKHFDDMPYEEEPLLDTASTATGQPRQPTRALFHPVGHTALEIGSDRNATFDLGLADDALWIKSLYLSWPLQSTGLGRSAMLALEAVAAAPPLSAPLVVLDTAHKDWQLLEVNIHGFYEGRGRARPKTVKSTQEWYARLGYEEIKHVKGAYPWTHPVTGEVHGVTLVWMRKMLKPVV